MVKEDNSRRSFFKKAAAAVGVVAVAGYAKNLIPAPADSAGDLSAKYANDVISQEKAWQKKDMVLMTSNEKKQMLDEMLNNYNKNKNKEPV